MTAIPFEIHSRSGGQFPVIPRRSVESPVSLDDAFGGSEAGRRLRLPGALAVTTGQQPGLLGGPLYTVHKALAARGLALALQKAWQTPVVPVFWMAGDDHDWTEATNTAWFSSDGEAVERCSLPERAHEAAQLPMYRSKLGSELDKVCQQLARSLPTGPERDRALDWVERNWTADKTVHEAFRSGISELLEPLGIACLDATHVQVKEAQQDLIRSALERAVELDQILANLPSSGTGIAAGDGATLVFVETEAGRDRIMVEGEGFKTRRSGSEYSKSQLFDLLNEAPQLFSANVLLRPVVESAILPTTAYVAGPGEYRYLDSQAVALYEPLGVHRQLPVKRWGGTIVDAVTQRLLGRLSLEVDSVLDDDGSLAKKLLLADLPPTAKNALSELSSIVDDAAAQLTRAGEQIDPVLERAIEGRRRKLQSVTADLESLILRHLKKRDDIAYSQFLRIQNRLKPLGDPQERVLGVAGALGRWGDAWLNTAALRAEEWAGSELVAPSLGS